MEMDIMTEMTLYVIGFLLFADIMRRVFNKLATMHGPFAAIIGILVGAGVWYYFNMTTGIAIGFLYGLGLYGQAISQREKELLNTAINNKLSNET